MADAENPPAFPFSAEYGHPAACGGMSLRDYFAGQALAGIADTSKINDQTDILACADIAFDLADAMLTARKDGQP